MKNIIYALLLLAIGGVGGYFYANYEKGKSIDRLITEQQKLLEQNQILLVENIKLKKRIDVNIDIMQGLTTSIDSLKTAQLNERKKNANRIRSLANASDADKLELWAVYAGEN
jgi:hypothetical protein